MSMYKVPQDVEAEDKLLGPFTFRQFIYLIITALGIAIAWALGSLFFPLFIIPVPLIVFFGALALPLRKDQPMEVYLAAMVSFYLKPHRRLWDADGVVSLIKITAPKTVEVQRTKDLSRSEAEERLSYLANIVDTGGWAVRGMAAAATNSSMNSDYFYEAQQTVDVLDNSAAMNQRFSSMIEQGDEKRRQEIINRMHQPQAAQPTVQTAQPAQMPPAPQPQQTYADPYANLAAPQAAPVQSVQPHYNPYPDSMNQSVIQPMSQQSAQTPTASQSTAQPVQAAPAPVPTVDESENANTSVKQVSPDIMNLVNQHDLSVEAIAHEANRIAKREAEDEGEVVISLR